MEEAAPEAARLLRSIHVHWLGIVGAKSISGQHAAARIGGFQNGGHPGIVKVENVGGEGVTDGSHKG